MFDDIHLSYIHQVCCCWLVVAARLCRDKEKSLRAAEAATLWHHVRPKTDSTRFYDKLRTDVVDWRHTRTCPDTWNRSVVSCEDRIIALSRPPLCLTADACFALFIHGGFIVGLWTLCSFHPPRWAYFSHTTTTTNQPCLHEAEAEAPLLRLQHYHSSQMHLTLKLKEQTLLPSSLANLRPSRSERCYCCWYFHCFKTSVLLCSFIIITCRIWIWLFP